jgi:hypothetical protein
MEGTYEYIEQAVADSRQGVVLQNVGGGGLGELLTVKSGLLRNVTRSFGPGGLLWTR